MITTDDLPGVEPQTVRRLLAVARSFAPCLQNLEGEDRETAIAILEGVAAELPAPGSSRIRSMSRNGTSTSFADVRSAFTMDDRTALRTLCGAATSLAASASPAGSFPASGIITDQWPEKTAP